MRLFNISAVVLNSFLIQVLKVPVDHSIPILRLHRTATDLHTQATFYDKHNDRARAYVLYKRYVTFVCYTVGAHRMYGKQQYMKERLQCEKCKCQK